MTSIGSILGEALTLGDHVNADQLHPPAYFSLDATQVSRGFLAGIRDEEETSRAPRSWIVVAGRNFGCGSSRETTLQGLLLGGVRAVVAHSFGRIFYRGAAALGLPCWRTDRPLHREILPGTALEIDREHGLLRSSQISEAVHLMPVDPFVAATLEAGGLLNWLQRPAP